MLFVFGGVGSILTKIWQVVPRRPILEYSKAQVEVLKLLYQQSSTAGDQGFAGFMGEKLPLPGQPRGTW